MMNIGDRVILTRDLGPISAGAEGIVTHTDGQGNLGVEITHDPECRPVTFLLPPAPPDFFRPGSECT